MKTAVHLINRLPKAKLGFTSPFEKLGNVKPMVSYFKVFGSVCYVFLHDHLRTKFDKKAIKCIFVGYDNRRKGWRCCDSMIGRCYVMRNVVFDEASSWWPLEKTEIEDAEKNEEDTHGKSQEKMCILPMTKDEGEENAVHTREVPGGTQ